MQSFFLTAQINVTSINGEVTITGLPSDANTKLFDPDIQAVWSCNPWQGNPCSGNETITNLTTGVTYFVSVQSSTLDEWIPIYVLLGDGEPNQICDADIISQNGGLIISGAPSNATVNIYGAAVGPLVTVCSPSTNPCTNVEIASDLIIGQTATIQITSPDCQQNLSVFIVGAPNNPSCDDMIQNQGEEGVDCGGPCQPCTTPCNLSVTPTNGGVTITGLSSAENTKIFTADYSQILWSCNPWEGNPCTNFESVSGLQNGTDYLLVANSGTCVKNIPFTAGGGGGCPDSDGDGTCNAQDCQPFNANFPANPGSSCNDNNNSTTNDVIQADGCSCQGTPIGGGCNINTSTSNGSVTITGLPSDANTKLFDSNFQAVFSCNPWQGNPCSGNETASGLSSGATYFLSVQSNNCDEWIPVTVSGGGGNNNNGPDLLSNNLNPSSGSPGNVVTFTFNLVNQGTTTASGNYYIRSYISTDANLSNNDIQEGQIFTGNTPVGSLPVTGAIAIPNLSPGTYYLILKVDDNNNITESNENNNITSKAFTISGFAMGDDVQSIEVPNEDMNPTFSVSKLFPMPVRDELIIQLETSMESEVEINLFAATGQKVKNEIISIEEGLNSFSLDCSTIPSGMYHLILNNGDHIHTEKVVITR